jgi:hypothetical protein
VSFDEQNARFRVPDMSEFDQAALLKCGNNVAVTDVKGL